MSSSGSIQLREYSPDPWSHDNVQQFIDAWGLTSEQVDKMWDLQRRLRDIQHFKNEPEAVLRFMFAPTGYDAAEDCFRKMVQWRIDNSVDTILEDYNPPQEFLENNAAAMLHGLDRDGDPIYVERGGQGDVVALLKKYGHEELYKFAIWTRELHTRGAWISDYERRQGRRIKGITVVYDLKGMSTKQLNPKVLDLFGDIMKFSHANYPGPIKRMIIIRSNFVFRYAWNIVKHFFRQSLRRKMIFAPRNYIAVLDEFIPREVLPPCIAEAGVGKVAIGMPPLIGDVCQAPNSSEALFTDVVGKTSDSSSDGSCRPSLTEVSDDGSTASDEAELAWASSGSRCPVSSSTLLTGVWIDNESGSEIFTRYVA